MSMTYSNEVNRDTYRQLQSLFMKYQTSDRFSTDSEGYDPFREAQCFLAAGNYTHKSLPYSLYRHVLVPAPTPICSEDSPTWRSPPTTKLDRMERREAAASNSHLQWPICETKKPSIRPHWAHRSTEAIPIVWVPRWQVACHIGSCIATWRWLRGRSFSVLESRYLVSASILSSIEVEYRRGKSLSGQERCIPGDHSYKSQGVPPAFHSVWEGATHLGSRSRVWREIWCCLNDTSSRCYRFKLRQKIVFFSCICVGLKLWSPPEVLGISRPHAIRATGM